AWRASKADVAPALKEGGAGSGPARSRLRSLLVTAQVAISLILLVCAGLCLRSLQSAQQIDPGFTTRNGVAVSLSLRADELPKAARANLVTAVIDRIRSVPGVDSVGLISHLPLQFEIRGESYEFEGHRTRDGKPEDVDEAQAGPGYFRSMGIGLLRGRDFA